MRIGSFATNEKAEVEGVWENIGDGASILVARAGNVRYSNLIREKMAGYKTSIQRQNMSDDESNRILCDTMAETILLGWKGLQDDNAVDVVYSTKKASEYLFKYKEFKDLVNIVASNVANYRAEGIEVIQDNIKK